jgi:hypothetical protein
LKPKEQLSFLAQRQNRSQFLIINSEKIKFEFSLNFKGVQTFWEKCHKFIKILSCGCLHECEFIWSYLYSRIWSFYKGPFWLGLKIKRY